MTACGFCRFFVSDVSYQQSNGRSLSISHQLHLGKRAKDLAFEVVSPGAKKSAEGRRERTQAGLFNLPVPEGRPTKQMSG